MFKIEIIKNTSSGILDIEDTSVCEAIQAIYMKDHSPLALMNWNKFIIPINGITIACLYNDIINMLEFIELRKPSFTTIFFDNCFTAQWNSELIGDDIKVTAFWTEIASFGRENTTVEKLKEVSNAIVVNQKEFLQSWETLLKVIKKKLISAGYDNKLEDFEYLDTL